VAYSYFLVCKLAKEGVDAIFGPSSIETSGIVSSIAMKLEIPHIIYHWKTKPLHWEKTVLHNMTLNLYPDSDTLAEAFANVLVDYDWMSYTIVYENKENLIRLKDVLQIHGPDSHAIALRQLDNNYGELLKEILTRGDTNIVLDISVEKIIPFLTEASRVNMLTEYNQYFITNLDTATLNLSVIPNLASNITCLRLIEPDKVELSNALHLWQQRGLSEIMDETQIHHEAGLVHDALQIYFKTLQANGPTHTNKSRLDCFKKHQKSQNGFQNMNFMKTQEYDGVTGLVEFNNIEPYKGSRTQFTLEILELSMGSFRKIGYWDTTSRIKYDRNSLDPEQQVIEAIQNKMFKIVVKLGEPFLIERKAEEGTFYEGNARYEGYVVDLINYIQLSLRFKYELEVVPDGQYGNLNHETKRWNGLVKHLLDRKADLAVADLTITYERKTAVDFTSPFMTLGIGILFVKPPKKETNQFSFLDPFTTNVWIYTGLAYVSISIFTLVLSRINNDDWESSHPCIQEPEEVESIWNFSNCVWLSMGSIMGQGCDILPK
jgi:glutamate receptor, ionotropic, invertebrate